MFWICSVKTAIRSALKLIWMVVVYYSGLLGWAKRRIAAQGGILVLAFHRVLPDVDFAASNSTAGMLLREKTFESIAQYLSTRYQICGVAEPDWNTDTRSLRIAFTFDDGWIDTARVAYPIAQRYKIPVGVFVCPGLVGTTMPFWPERVVAAWRSIRQTPPKLARVRELLDKYQGSTDQSNHQTWQTAESVVNLMKRLSVDERSQLIGSMQSVLEVDSPLVCSSSDSTMSWDDIAAMDASGAALGSHTVDHAILSKVPREEAECQLLSSKQALEHRLGRKCSLFAYPSGAWSREVRDMVQCSGYDMAFVDSGGVWTRSTDPFLIPRVTLYEEQLMAKGGSLLRIALEYTIFWRPYCHASPLPPAFSRDVLEQPLRGAVS